MSVAGKLELKTADGLLLMSIDLWPLIMLYRFQGLFADSSWYVADLESCRLFIDGEEVRKPVMLDGDCECS